MPVEIVIQPATIPEEPLAPVVAEVTFDREISEAAAGRELIAAVRSTTSVTLDSGLNGRVVLDDAETTSAEISLLASDGTALVERTVDLTASPAKMVITDEEVKRLRDGGQTLPTVVVPPTTTRTARLVPSGLEVPDYVTSKLAVAAVATAQDLQALGVDDVFDTGGGTFMTATELTGADLSVLAGLAWHPTHVAIDGSFTATFPEAPTAGWLWWLTGQHQILGFVADDLSGPRGTIVLTLPAVTAAVGGDGHASAVEPCDCASPVPTDVTEAELVNNPGVYSEDPERSAGRSPTRSGS